MARVGTRYIQRIVLALVIVAVVGVSALVASRYTAQAPVEARRAPAVPAPPPVAASAPKPDSPDAAPPPVAEAPKAESAAPAPAAPDVPPQAPAVTPGPKAPNAAANSASANSASANSGPANRGGTYGAGTRGGGPTGTASAPSSGSPYGEPPPRDGELPPQPRTEIARVPPPPAASPLEMPAAPAPSTDLVAEAPAPDAEPGAPDGWTSGITFSVQIEAGIAGNPRQSAGTQNFGQLFTDHANQLQLNQVLLTLQRPIDPKAKDYDIGFKLQGMFGSDARYTHFLGELDRAIGDSRNQFDIVEANVIAHLPWLTEDGIDARLGQYTTPFVFETIDPATNLFYTHSYIFNFGVPVKHTGLLTTTHVNGTLDVWLGIDSGVNTTLFGGDNNSRPAGIVGIGLNNLADGKLGILASTHLGPENPTATVRNANRAMRYENVVDLTYKSSDALSFTTELNFIKDDAFAATAYGVAQYASYKLNGQLTLNGRAEIFRDNAGFFVGSFPGPLDFLNAQAGRRATVIGAGPITYGAMTLGATYRPVVPASISTLMFRPEIRYDRALSGNHAFNKLRDVDAITLSTDAVLAF